MCVVAYLRAESESGVEVSVLMKNFQHALMKQKIVLKLELQAALYALRLRQRILEGHEIDTGKVYHWTYFLTVLQWLRSAHEKQHVFVAYRIGEILDKPIVDEWRHVRGRLNPADIGTRGMAVSKSLQTEWLTDPALFCNPPETWRGQKLQEEPEEVRTVQLNQTLESVIDRTKFSDFRKLPIVIAYCFRIKSRQKARLALTKWVVLR